MDLSVIIVNWKVRDLLKKCLESVYRETRDIGIEVIVVDNDSRDGSVEMVLHDFPQAQLIASNRNLGFAKANNEAIARSRGEFVILLNPDTELRDNALAKLVAFMRRTPQAAIAGPKLLNPDGTLQRSVRRFPTFLSSLLVLLKFHVILPKLPPLCSLRADDFDYGRAAPCDQVMGAAFIIRRPLLEAIGPLDTGYYIWFEEVDYCRAAVSAGFQVWYTPEAEVIHHGGESFAQVFGPRKQRVFNDSLFRYIGKHHGLLAGLALRIVHPLSMALAWLAEGYRRFTAMPAGSVRPSPAARRMAAAFRTAFPLIILFEILSFFGLLLPAFSAAAFVIVVGAALILAFVRFDLAVLVLLAELFIGSQGGYLVSIGASSGTYVSLRLGLFLVVFGVWAARSAADLLTAAIRRRRPPAGTQGPEMMEWLGVMRRGRLFWPYLALLAVLGLSTLHGVLAGNDFGDVFFDANGYAFFALFPALIVALRTRETALDAAGLLLAAVTSSVIKALFVLYVFSHRMFYAAPSIYVWVRDTRVGEITRMVGDFYRIFFQSHLFALVGIFTLLLLVAYAGSWKSRAVRAGLAIAVVMATGIIMGFSRSFWFGGFGGTLVLAALLVWGRAGSVIWKRLAAAATICAVGAALIIVVSYSLPFPRKGAQVSLASLLGERAFSLSGEAAANSRWALLPVLWQAGLRHPFVGSGMGTTVKYTTSDPRLLADLPTGEYVTFAFEWGYHDLWVKFGLLGLAVYGWLLWAVIAPFWKVVRRSRRGLGGSPGEVRQTALVAIGAIVAMTTLLFTNVFSPYLNHPLGIGLLMCLGAVGAWKLLEDGDLA